jgi:hypothetical protein
LEPRQVNQMKSIDSSKTFLHNEKKEMVICMK